jgi:hypothetical protein
MSLPTKGIVPKQIMEKHDNCHNLTAAFTAGFSGGSAADGISDRVADRLSQ